MIKKTSLNIQYPHKPKTPEYLKQFVIAVRAHCSLVNLGMSRAASHAVSASEVLLKDLDGKTRFSANNCDFVAVGYALNYAHRATSSIRYLPAEQGVELDHEWYDKKGKRLATIRFQIDQAFWIHVLAWGPRVLTSDSA